MTRRDRLRLIKFALLKRQLQRMFNTLQLRGAGLDHVDACNEGHRTAKKPTLSDLP